MCPRKSRVAGILLDTEALLGISKFCIEVGPFRYCGYLLWRPVQFGLPVIEFSNLRDVGTVIVYVPYYMPITNRKFVWTDDQLVHDPLGRLVDLNPDLLPEDLIDARVARLRDAQPICDVGFAAKIPPVQTGIRGLQIADTCFYYPEDRGIAESVRLGRDMASAIYS